MISTSLIGWSPDREMQVVSAMLSEAGLPQVEGHFSGAEFIAAPDSDMQSLAAIAAYFAPPSPAQLRETSKAARTAAVAAITVTTSTGKTFDGDETSQTRMSRAIIGLQAAGVPTIVWTLADNTTAAVTLAELTEAMILAGQQQSAMWALP